MTTRREPTRCVCANGDAAHLQHCKPGRQVGRHLDPRCPHSELRNTTSAYANRRAQIEERRHAHAEANRRTAMSRARLVR